MTTVFSLFLQYLRSAQPGAQSAQLFPAPILHVGVSTHCWGFRVWVCCVGVPTHSVGTRADLPLTLLSYVDNVSTIIKSFRCKETEKIYWDQRSRKFPPDLHKRAKIKLDMLEATQEKSDLRSPPSNHLEELSGDYAGFMSFRINKQFRLVFRFENANACDMHITDYH